MNAVGPVPPLSFASAAARQRGVGRRIRGAGPAELPARTTRELQTFKLPADAQDPLQWTLIAFAFAALASIFTQLPMRYEEASVKGLRGLLEESWDDTEEEALEAVAHNRLNVLNRAKYLNSIKAWALFAAVFAEAIAVIALAVAMTRLF